jgi:hypothetical protein
MPIKIVNGGYGGRPAILCDGCGREITSVDRGNYHWRWPDEDRGADLYFSHKECCSFVDDRENTEACLELGDLLLCLTVNLEYDHKRAMAKEEFFPSFVWGKPRRKRKRQRSKT